MIGLYVYCSKNLDQKYLVLHFAKVDEVAEFFGLCRMASNWPEKSNQVKKNQTEISNYKNLSLKNLESKIWSQGKLSNL